MPVTWSLLIGCLLKELLLQHSIRFSARAKEKLSPWSKRMKIRRRAESKLVASLFISLFISLSSIQGGDSSELGTSSTLDGKEVNDSIEIHCSRERSRAARKIIDEYLMPFVEKERHRIPRNCRLHEDNNIFRDNEEHKIHSDMNEWKCGYCKKSFYEEKFLDKHFETRHRNSLNVSNGKCLADICGALHCDIAMELPQKTKCNPAAASRNKNLCEGLADSCFPVSEGPSVSRLHEFFLRQFCDAHTCTGNRKPFPRGRKRRSNTAYIVISVLTFLLLLFFYSFLYMYQRGLKKGTSNLRRLSQHSGKKKPS